jgi:hypothetical protein
MLIGYARVSTFERNLDLETDASCTEALAVWLRATPASS